MEKSFATLDRETDNYVPDQLNSTALNDGGFPFVPPKTPQRDDVKISPILRDEPRSAFHKRMAEFKNRGESPLARPTSSKNHSLMEISTNSNSSDTGYNTRDHPSDATFDNSSKENHRFNTPQRVEIHSVLRNPFESRLLETIHTTTLSPNLMEILPSPKEKPWPIEHRSILCPANITEEEIRMSRSAIDPEFEEQIHQRLEIYWESGVGYVPSPDGPRPIFIGSPVASCRSSELSSIRRMDSPAARPQSARRRFVTVRNVRSQTDLTIPPRFNFDFAKVLGQRFVYEEESPEMPEEEFDVSLNTSLPRKLFNDNSLDEEDMELAGNDENSQVRQDLDHSPVRGSSLKLDLDFSPIRSE